MTDYIERGGIMARIAAEALKWGEDYDADQILGDIEDFPAADVRPVEYGKWIFDDPLRGDFMCSNCLERQIVCSRYCPDCGADMRTEFKGFVPLDNAKLEDADFSLADRIREENET